TAYQGSNTRKALIAVGIGKGETERLAPSGSRIGAGRYCSQRDRGSRSRDRPTPRRDERTGSTDLVHLPQVDGLRANKGSIEHDRDLDRQSVTGARSLDARGIDRALAVRQRSHRSGRRAAPGGGIVAG